MRLKLWGNVGNLNRWLAGCREAAVHKAFYQNNVASEARQRADSLLTTVSTGVGAKGA